MRKLDLGRYKRRKMFTGQEQAFALQDGKREESLPMGQVSVIIRRDKKPGVCQMDPQEGRIS